MVLRLVALCVVTIRTYLSVSAVLKVLLDPRNKCSVGRALSLECFIRTKVQQSIRHLGRTFVKTLAEGYSRSLVTSSWKQGRQSELHV